MNAAGTIAYVRGAEIRLIEPDGTNDRRIWIEPTPSKEGSSIYELAWRPDGKELAFSSSHSNLFSFYHTDIYAIKPDGTGLRKITNAPDRSGLGRYPKGAVSVTVRNTQPIWTSGQASTGQFIIYVVGADEPQAVVIPPGSSRTLLFKSVADFGDTAQPIVAIYGSYRWFMGTVVTAGRTITSPVFEISGDGIPSFGAFRPVWRSDGSCISYRDGLCLVKTVPAHPKSGELVFESLFAGKEQPSGSCAWDWGPTPALADQIIYTSNGENDGSNVMRIKEGGTHPGTKLHTFFSEADGQILNDLRWLTDGSGFLYSFPDYAYENGNIFRYDIATKRLTKLTNFEGEYTRSFDISPDGAWVVFERVKKLDDESGDLWIMRTDGTGQRLVVRNGINPAW
jgi:TolB protein